MSTHTSSLKILFKFAKKKNMAWQKLIQNNITENCVDVIVYIYFERTSRIAVYNNFSANFHAE